MHDDAGTHGQIDGRGLLEGRKQVAHAAVAHPLDEGRQDVAFSIEDGHLKWTHDLWLGPLVALPIWTREIDANQDLAASAEERAAYARQLGDSLELEVDGQATPFQLASIDIAPYRDFLALPAAPQVSAVFTAPISAGDHTLALRSRLDPRQYRLTARFPSGGGVRVQSPRAADGEFTAEVSIKPAALAAAAPAVVQTPAAPSPPMGAAAAVLMAILVAAALVAVLVVWRARRAR